MILDLTLRLIDRAVGTDQVTYSPRPHNPIVPTSICIARHPMNSNAQWHQLGFPSHAAFLNYIVDHWAPSGPQASSEAPLPRAGDYIDGHPRPSYHPRAPMQSVASTYRSSTPQFSGMFPQSRQYWYLTTG